jgi:uncharacterized SAM-binding protein YcdF (DUF218 family)
LIGAAAIAAYTSLRIWQVGEQDEARPADAIVILGAAQYDGSPSPVFEARLDHAVSLYEAGLARVLVMTGGGAEGDRTTEAAVGRAYALARGVPDSAILVEDRSRTTVQSLEAVGAMLRQRGLRNVVFVSDRTHMLRVLRIARDEGLTTHGSPTPDSPIDADLTSRSSALLHELGALALYFVGAGTLTFPDTPGG